MLSDTSPMPFGKHKGTNMANVPAAYLLWLGKALQKLQKEQTLNANEKLILAYIEDFGFENLKKEVSNG